MASVLGAWSDRRFDTAVRDAFREVACVAQSLADDPGAAFGATRALEAVLQADRILRALDAVSSPRAAPDEPHVRDGSVTVDRPGPLPT
jgi:hypothetical protein